MNNYKALLKAEKELEQNVNDVPQKVKQKFGEAIDPKHLFPFLEENVEKSWQSWQSYSGKDEDWKNYLVSLLLDYIVHYITQQFLENKNEKEFNYKGILRNIIEKYYYENESLLKEITLHYVDQVIAKIKQKF